MVESGFQIRPMREVGSKFQRVKGSNTAGKQQINPLLIYCKAVFGCAKKAFPLSKIRIYPF
jgi:hypothetical protein